MASRMAKVRVPLYGVGVRRTYVLLSGAHQTVGAFCRGGRRASVSEDEEGERLGRRVLVATAIEKGRGTHVPASMPGALAQNASGMSRGGKGWNPGLEMGLEEMMAKQ